MKKALLALSLLVFAGSLGWAQEARVAVAANLREAFGEIARAYERKTGGKVLSSFGSSGAFVQQILQGAPFDLFIAADAGFPKRLFEKGKGLEAPRVYARGKLILFIPKRVGLKPQTLQVLLDPKVRKAAMANPEVAPYGRAAREALRRAGLWEKVEPKAVFGQDIGQALQLTLAAADAGFIGLSALFSPSVRNRGEAWVVPQRLYDPLDQAALLLSEGGKGLYAFLFGEKARTILQNYGYETP